MRKMDKVLTASEKARVWSTLFMQRPDGLATRVHFGNLTSAKTLQDAAILHCRYIHSNASRAVRLVGLELRDNIITELDWEWPHVAFWEEVEKIDKVCPRLQA